MIHGTIQQQILWIALLQIQKIQKTQKIQKKQKMETIPLWGTCLGFETIINYIASWWMFSDTFGYSNVILNILSNPNNQYTVMVRSFTVRLDGIIIQCQKWHWKICYWQFPKCDDWSTQG